MGTFLFYAKGFFFLKEMTSLAYIIKPKKHLLKTIKCKSRETEKSL